VVKLRSASLDEVFQELQFVLDQDSGLPARAVRWFFVRAYRGLRAAILLALSRRWRTGSLPPIGYEPFNLTPEELERACGGGGSQW
jgi:hypothetical protein